MSKSNTYVFDIETDGLLDECTKIHCLSYQRMGDTEVKSITDYDRIRLFLKQEDLTLIGHHIVLYDIPVLKKILNVDFTPKRVIDTLGISWYLNSSKDSSFKHGLDTYGEKFGIIKPKVDDWKNLTLEEYIHRCNEDVKINMALAIQQLKQLNHIYDRDWDEVFRLTDYIHFKLDCMEEQQRHRLKLDINLITYEINRLGILASERRDELLKVMPNVKVKAKRSQPKVMYKQDGELSQHGKKWLEFLMDNNLPEDTSGEVEYIQSEDAPNPDSNTQIKDWLFSLGWTPIHYKFIRNKETNEFRQVPQIVSEYSKEELCPSVIELSESVPEINLLAGYSTIKHRMKIFEGFLRDADEFGRLQAEVGGFTNTFRIKHRTIVNLPKPNAPYAEYIRAVFLSNDGGYMIGSDLSGIEDATKQHYIYKYDPDYVNSMQTPDWDAHTDVSVKANLMTEDEQKFYKWYDGNR